MRRHQEAWAEEEAVARLRRLEEASGAVEVVGRLRMHLGEEGEARAAVRHRRRAVEVRVGWTMVEAAEERVVRLRPGAEVAEGCLPEQRRAHCCLWAEEAEDRLLNVVVGEEDHQLHCSSQGEEADRMATASLRMEVGRQIEFAVPAARQQGKNP